MLYIRKCANVGWRWQWSDMASFQALASVVVMVALCNDVSTPLSVVLISCHVIMLSLRSCQLWKQACHCCIYRCFAACIRTSSAWPHNKECWAPGKTCKASIFFEPCTAQCLTTLSHRVTYMDVRRKRWKTTKHDLRDRRFLTLSFHAQGLQGIRTRSTPTLRSMSQEWDFTSFHDFSR